MQLPHVDVDLDLELAVADVAMGLIWLGHGDEPGRTEGANMFGPESVEGLTSSSISHPQSLVPIPSSLPISRSMERKESVHSPLVRDHYL